MKAMVKVRPVVLHLHPEQLLVRKQTPRIVEARVTKTKTMMMTTLIKPKVQNRMQPLAQAGAEEERGEEATNREED